MSDFSDALAKSFKNVFDNPTRAKCFFHLKQNIIKRYTKKMYCHLEEYLQLMGSCLSVGELDFLWPLIKKDILAQKEIKSISRNFVQYFENTYLIDENKKFFIGALPPGYSSTDNLLEGHHRHLKQNIFERKVRHISIEFLLFSIIFLGDFLQMLPSVVRELSRTRTKEKFSKSPLYTSKVFWEKAQQLQKHICYSNQVYFFANFRFIKNGNKEITPKIIGEYEKSFKDSKTFKQFMKRNVLYIYDHDDKVCDCYNFWHHAYCKHVLANMIHLEEVEVIFFLTIIKMI